MRLANALIIIIIIIIKLSEAILVKICTVYNDNSSRCAAYFERQEDDVLQIWQRQIHHVCHEAAQLTIIYQTLIYHHTDMYLTLN